MSFSSTSTSRLGSSHSDQLLAIYIRHELYKNRRPRERKPDTPRSHNGKQCKSSMNQLDT